MKRFIDFLNEAELSGSKGLPSDYLSDVERKAQRELGVVKDSPQTGGRYFSEIMKLTQDASRVAYAGLSPQQQREVAEKLEKLAKEVIYSEYGNILDNVDLDIKLVPFGKVSEEMPELSDIPESPASKREQEREMQGGEEEKVEKEQTDRKKSFLDKLFKKEKEKEQFVGSEEYKERVDKAKLINNIIQGEAKNTKKILHSEIVKQGLTKIFGTPKDKQMFKIWDDLTKVADKLDWIIPISDKAKMLKSQPGGLAGSVQIKWPESEQAQDYDEEEMQMEKDDENTPSPRDAEDILKELESGKDLGDLEEEIDELFSHGNPVIKVVGVDFPMLLHETVKGIYELIAAAYLPSVEAQKEEIKKAKVVKMAVSSYEDEAEDFRYGPFIAASLRDFINSCKDSDKYPNMREYVFGKMVLLESKEFLSLMKGILEKTSQSKLKVEQIIQEIIEEIREYEISLIDEPDYGDEEKEEVEEDEIEKLIKKSQEPDEVESDEVDYSKMSKKELQEVIDQALQDEDWATLDKINPFIKESLEWRIYESEINRIRNRRIKK